MTHTSVTFASCQLNIENSKPRFDLPFIRVSQKNGIGGMVFRSHFPTIINLANQPTCLVAYVTLL